MRGWRHAISHHRPFAITATLVERIARPFSPLSPGLHERRGAGFMTSAVARLPGVEIDPSHYQVLDLDAVPPTSRTRTELTHNLYLLLRSRGEKPLESVPGPNRRVGL